MSDHESRHLALVAKYAIVQKDPNWDEQSLNILNAAIAEAHEMVLAIDSNQEV